MIPVPCTDENINILIEIGSPINQRSKSSKYARLRIYYVAGLPVVKPGQSRQNINPEVQLQNYSYIYETFCQTNVHAKLGNFRRFRI